QGERYLLHVALHEYGHHLPGGFVPSNWLLSQGHSELVAYGFTQQFFEQLGPEVVAHARSSLLEQLGENAQLIRGLEASSILPGLRTQQEIEDLRMYLEWRATVGNPGPLDRLSRFRSAASSSSLTPHPTSFGTAAGNVASELGRGLLVQELLSFGPC